jgi:hypothetical protein
MPTLIALIVALAVVGVASIPALLVCAFVPQGSEVE